MTHCVWNNTLCTKVHSCQESFSCWLWKKFPSVNFFYTSAAIDVMDKYQVWAPLVMLVTNIMSVSKLIKLNIFQQIQLNISQQIQVNIFRLIQVNIFQLIQVLAMSFRCEINPLPRQQCNFIAFTLAKNSRFIPISDAAEDKKRLTSISAEHYSSNLIFSTKLDMYQFLANCESI